ncbi:hypothetical protein [Streptosporangium sp. 'caverna']|uniref:hypothetical protein n=1 Tax=Streptosporangium sp. 'caverna' TaxID=2202249 RepID=UPI000D7DD824|nr:hypothetical protein [Streptosporangium sp. 'caverna']AWS40189.1 hypothetical protein DKM19_01430 [Streptosporangium sp. 'caverna']
MGDYTAIDGLHDSYTVMRDIWQGWISDTSKSDDAPAFQWMRPDSLEGIPATNWETILKVAELSAYNANLGVLQHLRTLVNAYPDVATRGGSVDPDYWPGFAAFTIARSILEGTALVRWLLDADVAHHDRAERSARLILWSAHHDNQWQLSADPAERRQTHRTPQDLKTIIEGAGFTVASGRRGQLVVGKSFGHTEVIDSAFGEWGKQLYRRWSGAAHHAPWVLGPNTRHQLAADGGGLWVNSTRQEGAHIELAADVADAILKAGNTLGVYWGRVPGMLHDQISDLAVSLRATAPGIDT